jgi:hypothetical protein
MMIEATVRVSMRQGLHQSICARQFTIPPNECKKIYSSSGNSRETQAITGGLEFG